MYVLSFMAGVTLFNGNIYQTKKDAEQVLHSYNNHIVFYGKHIEPVSNFFIEVPKCGKLI